MNHIVREDGGRLAWWSAGQGDPVLLVMGLGARGKAWHRQVQGLRDRHRLAWFDHRGVGESDPTQGRVTMQTLAADALAVADALGMQRFHLVGVSMGGMVSQHIALRHRERVQSLSLIATHPGGWAHRLPPWTGLRLVPLTRSRNPEQRVRTLARLLFPPKHLQAADPAELHAALREDFGDYLPARTFLGQVRAVLGHDTRARLAELGGLPTLIVRPGQDNLVRMTGSDALARGIPGARLLRLDQAGHGVIRQCAAELNAALLELFVQSPPV